MGGNVTVKDISGNLVPAEKVNLKEIGRSVFRKQSLHLFKTLNELHKQQFGSMLWDPKNLDSAIVFNGSTSFIFSTDFTDEQILNVKPLAGDIDIAVPDVKSENLFFLLKALQDEFVTSNVQFIGMNRTSSSSLGTQINCIFKFFSRKDYLVQVDFEFLPFDDLGPTEWARFSHSSSFKDAEAGIKAVHHKYLLRAITGALSLRPDIVIATPKSTPGNIKLKKTDEVVRMLKFSVDHGVRSAYKPMLDEQGVVKIDGKLVYQELPTSASSFKKTVPEIFKLLFNDESPDQDKMWNFVGLIDLIKKYTTKNQQRDIAGRYFELLWGSKAYGGQRAQQLERDSAEEDAKVKMAGWTRFCKDLNIPNPPAFEDRLSAYYKDY